MSYNLYRVIHVCRLLFIYILFAFLCKLTLKNGKMATFSFPRVIAKLLLMVWDADILCVWFKEIRLEIQYDCNVISGQARAV